MLIEQLGFEPFRLLAKRRRKRVVYCRRPDPKKQRHNDGRRDELPSRHSGRAGDNELEPARQIEEARHRADQHCERHQALGDLGNAKERGLGNRPGRNIGNLRGAPHQLDVVDQDYEHEHPDEYGERGAEESPGEVSCERERDHAADPVTGPARRAKCSANASIARVNAAGGSSSAPREMAMYDNTNAAASAAYITTIAAGI